MSKNRFRTCLTLLGLSLSLSACLAPNTPNTSPIPSASPSATAEPTPAPTEEATPAPSPTASPNPTPTPTPTASPSPAESVSPSPTTPSPELRLDVESPLLLTVGETRKLTAIRKDANGQDLVLEDVALNWFASPADTLSVSLIGEVKALRGPGSATLAVHIPNTDLRTEIAVEIVLSDPNAQPSPSGYKFREIDEFQISEDIHTESISQNSVAMNKNGDFVVAWFDSTDRFEDEIHARCFDGRGDETHPEFQVNTYTTHVDDGLVSTAIALNGKGEFVIAWSGGSEDDLEAGTEIMARRYDEDCKSLGKPFQVNQSTEGHQQHPAVAIDEQGNFVVVWEDVNPDTGLAALKGRRYNQDGTVPGSEFRVSTIQSERDHRWPALVLDPEGEAQVVWSSHDLENDEATLRMRRFDKTDNPKSEQALVTLDAKTATLSHPQVARDAEGDYVIVWQDNDPTNGSDADYWGIHGRLYHTDDILKQEFQANEFTLSGQIEPTVGMDAEGNFVVAWSSFGQNSDEYSIYAQKYNRDGSKDGEEFRLSRTDHVHQTHPSIAMNSAGHFIATWVEGGFEVDGDRMMGGNGS